MLHCHCLTNKIIKPPLAITFFKGLEDSKNGFQNVRLTGLNYPSCNRDQENRQVYFQLNRVLSIYRWGFNFSFLTVLINKNNVF